MVAQQEMWAVPLPEVVPGHLQERQEARHAPLHAVHRPGPDPQDQAPGLYGQVKALAVHLLGPPAPRVQVAQLLEERVHVHVQVVQLQEAQARVQVVQLQEVQAPAADLQPEALAAQEQFVQEAHLLQREAVPAAAAQPALVDQRPEAAAQPAPVDQQPEAVAQPALADQRPEAVAVQAVAQVLPAAAVQAAAQDLPVVDRAVAPAAVQVLPAADLAAVAQDLPAAVLVAAGLQEALAAAALEEEADLDFNHRFCLQTM